MFVCGVHYGLGASDHDAFKAIVDLCFRPEELRNLRPFKVADGYAASVGDDVRHHGDAAVVQDIVGLQGRRAVSAFDDQSGRD